MSYDEKMRARGYDFNERTGEYVNRETGEVDSVRFGGVMRSTLNQRSRPMGVDKFGNNFAVVGCKDKKGNGFPKGFLEIKGLLYKFEPSPAQKDGVHTWIRVTALKKNQGGDFSRGGGGRQARGL